MQKIHARGPAARVWRILTVVACAALVTLPGTAQAFKVSTHIWVGQQVLNDLQDGRLSFRIDGVDYTVPVDAGLAGALIGNPDFYRMGNVGPDAFPDALSGQNTVHPGVDGGWKTDQWLDWLLQGEHTSQELALVYGFLAHAAADTFAHTYINTYAGDAFNVTDQELHVEARHIFLEEYIAQRTPPLEDHTGNPIGAPYEVLATPAAYLRDRLVLDPTIAEQNRRGGLRHLSLVYQLRLKLNEILDGPLEDIENYVAGEILKALTGIEAAGALGDAFEDLASDYSTQVLSNELTEEAQKLHNKFVEKYLDGVKDGAELAGKLNNNLLDIVTLSGDLEQAIRDLADAQGQLAAIPQYFFEQICETVKKWQCSNIISCGWVSVVECSTIAKLNPMWVDYSNIVNELLDQKNTIADELEAVKQLQANLITDAAHAYAEFIEVEVEAANRVIDFFQRVTGDIDPVRGILEGWVEDIDNGMTAYIATSAEVIAATMRADADPLDPVKEWLSCHGAAIFGVPSPATHLYCSASNKIDDLVAELDDIIDLLGATNPLVYQFQWLKEKITDELARIAREAAIAYVEKTTGVDVVALMDLLKTPVNAQTLDGVFAVDESGKHLLTIDNVSARVNAEMALTPSGYFDPDRYAVAYDAVVLAKLTLLTPQQLNQIAIDAGIIGPEDYPDGSPLYPSSGAPFNVLHQAVRSIDGNHQWMPVAPPYPRQAGFLVLDDRDARSYGYDALDGKGMRIFQDERARTQLFMRLFKGPLVPGVETPRDLGFKRVLPRDYPYKVCAGNPFPRDENDASCDDRSNGGAGHPLPGGGSPAGTHSNAATDRAAHLSGRVPDHSAAVAPPGLTDRGRGAR